MKESSVKDSGVKGRFSDNYIAARKRFYQACDRQQIPVECFEHPSLGPGGETLSTEVALVGNPKAEKLMILVSGTHGAEVLVGSGCQIAWLESQQHKRLHDNIAVLLVHAINPYGAAWRSRYTEDNVDLNRNFVDHNQAYPDNAHYADLHDALTCRTLDGPEKNKAEKHIADFCRAQGEKTYIDALCQGQYSHPDGLGFGGNKPTWSNRTLHQILKRYAQQAKQVAVIDYHSGIGPYGYGSLYTRHREGTQSLMNCRQWYGNSLMESATIKDTAYPVFGCLCQGVEAALTEATVTSVLVEYGTFDFKYLISAFRQHALLYDSRQIEPAQQEQLRAGMQQFFYPASDDWLEMVWFRSEQVIRQTLVGLAHTSL